MLLTKAVLQAPRFDGGSILSQDPAISYIWSEKNLNADQRRAIIKVDFIFGVPFLCRHTNPSEVPLVGIFWYMLLTQFLMQILTAKDYALILGMPGTGKTSTLVYAIKALLMRGASVLLTSYTNSAVDNLLIKLKIQVISLLTTFCIGYELLC